MKEAAEVPGFWRLLWMLFMQPITLRHLLGSAGVEADASGWRLLDYGPGRQRTYFLRMVALLVLITPAAIMLMVFALGALGFESNLVAILLGVSLGIAGGVALGIAWGIAGGVVWGVALGIAWGVAGGFAWGVDGGVAWGIAMGMALGVAVSAAVGVAGGGALGVHWGIAGGVALGIAWGIAGGVALGVAWGLAWGGAAMIALFRLPLFVVEAPFQIVLFAIEKIFGIPTLRFAPVLHHDLSYIPHPFLQAHLVLAAERDLSLIHRALEACAIAPGQRALGRRVLEQLQARELAQAAREQRFDRIVELEGEWLPGRQGASSLLLGFAEAARYLASAQATSMAYQRNQKLALASEQLRQLSIQLRGNSRLARFLLTEAFPIWRQTTALLLQEAKLAAADQLPNPFRAGEPLSPAAGKEVFRGREELIRSVETLLGEPGRGCSIVLVGPRRCGKTSLLKMLPFMLPDAVCILFDLQDNPIDSAQAFFPALERRAAEQAWRDRQVLLPKLPKGLAFEAGSRWIERLDDWAEDRRILLCIDEFERMESLFPGSRRELLQLLGLLRATIQHRQRIRVLVSGAAPFDELDALWNDHLINAREVRIGHLEEDTAIGLLRKPIDEFPEETIPNEVARAIFERTGGQPFLVQLYGSLLIARLNSANRRQASPEDLQPVEDEALQQATYYFRHTYQMAPGPAKAALLDLALDRTPELDAPTRRWLRRRLLLTENNRLSMPVLGAWLRGEEAN